ncbi:MAG TPA: L,D-transpeptidase family protein [Alphaproteobacteria bacterium]|nr:L,D-transpeptidase family protein [Alphaproteobacteria bacterium]
MTKIMTSINFFMVTAAALWAAAASAGPVAAVGEVQTYRTVYEDSLLDLARKYDVGYVEMIAANPVLDPWVPGAGKEITLPTMHLLPNAPHEGIVVNIAEMRLYYYPHKDAVPETYPIGIGEAGSETPSGTTRVTRKEPNPTWYRTKSEIAAKPWAPKIVPPGPDNPLGAYALHLGWPSYLIHGTDDWRGVGRRDSRGCIRMYPEDIERLFREVSVGTKVTMVNQPVKFAWIDGQLYIEVHPTPKQADQLEMENTDDFEDPVGLSKTILAAAGDAADRLDWEAIRRAAKDRNGIPIAITR